MKKAAFLILAVFIGLGVNAQSSQPKTASTTTIQKVIIQTNGVCDKCEKLFTETVPYFKGVKDFSYDKNTSKMTITYDSKKTNPDNLRLEISKLGYNADNVKADPAARAKLPACCQVEKKAGEKAKCEQGQQHKCGGCSGNHSNCSGSHSNCQGQQQNK